MFLATALYWHLVTCFVTNSRFSPSTVRSQNVHCATARATRPAQSAQSQNVSRTTARETRPTQSGHTQRVHFAISKCAPRHSESDSTHQRAAPATKSARKLESTAPATESARKALKCCVCHEICTQSSEVLRLSRKIALQPHAKRSKCCAYHEIGI